MTEIIIIHTDGSCHGNPGPGGFAAIIEYEDQEYIVSGGDPRTTNNRMELAAIIEAMFPVNHLAKYAPREIIVRSDSKYIIDAFNNGWIANWQKNRWRNAKGKAVANQDLWEKLLEHTKDHQITWVWVQGHSGDSMNERCDQLANEQADIAGGEPEYWSSVGMPKRRTPSQGNPGPHHNQVGTRTSTAPVYDSVYEEAMRTMAQEDGPAPQGEFTPQQTLMAQGGTGFQNAQARAEGYEAAKQEFHKYLLNLDSGPPPAYKDYIDGYKDCRSEVLQYLDRMKNHDDLPF